MYYLYYDGQQLQLVESELGGDLTQRLLLHAQPGAVDSEFCIVYGCVEDHDICWFTTKLPKINALAVYVEPATFTSDKDGRYWSLLSHEDAKRLLLHWKSLQNYTEKFTDKTNYFKNAVDCFEWEMDKKWSK